MVYLMFSYWSLKLFGRSKKNCDKLIVSITSDKYVNKGPSRPIFNNEQRMKILSNISFVDKVILSKSLTAEKVILQNKPNLYFKGYDYKNTKTDITSNIKKEINAVKKIGGKIFITKTPLHSSSKIINMELDPISNEIKKYKKISKNFYKKIRKGLGKVYKKISYLWRGNS